MAAGLLMALPGSTSGARSASGRVAGPAESTGAHALRVRARIASVTILPHANARGTTGTLDARSQGRQGRAERHPMKRILVGLDGSPRAPGVLATATEIARAQGARLILLRSVGLPPDVPQ